MRRLCRTCYDKLLLSLAVVLVATSCGWAWRQQPGLRRLRALPVVARLSGSEFEPASRQTVGAATTLWIQPGAQSHGRGWVYEVFSPPPIYYIPAAGSFTVLGAVQPVDDGVPFGLELIEVKLEPYCLQLAGYCGRPGDYLVAFSDRGLTGILLAREGSRIEEVGITLKSFAVRQVEVGSGDAGPVYEMVAFAIVQDETTGAEVELDSRTRKLTDKPFAVFRLRGEGNRQCQLAEGDSYSAGDSTYRVDCIRLDPPEVAVARLVPGRPVSENKILRPERNSSPPTAGKPGRSTRSSARPARGLAASDN